MKQLLSRSTPTTPSLQARQAGFHLLEAAVVILVIAALGFAGYRVWKLGQHTNPTGKTSQQVTAPAINTSKDLDSADSTIDQLDNSADTTDLTSVEQDLNNL